MALTYNTWLANLLTTCAISQTDPNYATTWALMIPSFIDYAEQRIYRKLDLRDTRISDYVGLAFPGNQIFVPPTDVGTFVAIEQIAIVTPAGSNSFAPGRTISVLMPATMDFIQTCYPSLSALGQPRYWAYYTASTGFVPAASGTPSAILLGPTPDGLYSVITSGTARPTPLSATNQTTILTNQFPDLFFAATMIPATGYMRDFGQQSDNPAMAVSWEGLYTELEGDALVEESRKKLEKSSWVSMLPPQATKV